MSRARSQSDGALARHPEERLRRTLKPSRLVPLF